MKKSEEIPVLYVTVAILLLMTFHISISYSQQRLSSSPKTAPNFIAPMIYNQPVTQDRIFIINQIQNNADSPQFSQKFSQSNISLLLQTQSPAVSFRQQVPKSQKNSLPIIDYGNEGMSRILALPCDDAPIGNNDLYVVGKDKILTIAAPGFLINDIDLQGEALTATQISDNVDHGTINALTDGSFTYTPAPGFVGTDQFQYRMKDASNNSSADIIVTIEVSANSNRTPIGTNDSFAALAGKILSISAPGFLGNDIDQDGDVITATAIVDNVDHGTINALTNGSFTYTPSPGFTGTDQFQYKMRDSELNDSDPITVTIEVLEGNRKPIGTDDSYGVVINTSLTIPAPGFLLNDIDPDGDVLTATVIVDNVDHGTLAAFANGSFTYTPTPGFTGTDQFQYKMRDPDQNISDPITVTIEVVGTGVLPVGFSDQYRTSDGSTLTIPAPGFLLNDIDQNGEALTATQIVDITDHGTLNALTNGSFIYTPSPGFVGTDQFQYKMKDASNNESEAITVTIEVAESFNRNPVGIDDEYATTANATLTIAAPGFLSNDIDQDGETLTATQISENVSHGTINALTDGSFSYTPTAGFIGTDQFKYRMRDASLNNSDDITVTIHIYEGNRNPSGTNDIFGVVKNTTLTIAAGGFLINDYDPDGDALTANSIVENVDHGILAALTDGSFTYTPASDFTGTDQFQYRMQDSKSNFSEPVTVTLEVVGPNLPPIASANNITTECTGELGTTVTLDGTSSSDPEGGALIFTWFENNNIIAGPNSTGMSDVSFETGVHLVKLKVEDECGLSSEIDIVVTVEDTTAPLVSAGLVPTGSNNMYMVSCSSSDNCSEIVNSSSFILIPNLTNPSISLKNKDRFSLEIDLDKNTVKVEAPNAASFWAKVNLDGGIEVTDGQELEVKYERNKNKYGFDSQGKLISVKAEVVTLRCTATDGNGNSALSEESLPMVGNESLNSSILPEDNSSIFHRNYPNPFTDKTTIQFSLPKPAFVQIIILDQNGKILDELAREQMEAGDHEVIWNSANRNSGVYFYRIQYNNNIVSNKLLLLR
ncbi:Ig-like domain-containing protein [Algoriphagus sp.]|uniref:Ig-like domain-containing protein n=1 Tax=Algoriphagus sp. TaxID=1872435 RepID=UPI0025FE7ECD|nr:Ig-like domain-containing protein [Algoriphagus sp.]